MIFTGALVNFLAVVAGSLIGLLFKNKLKQKYHTALIDVMALGIIAIGVSYAVQTKNILVMIVSLILGTLIGTFFKIDDRMESLGEKLQNRLKSANDSFSEGFAGASILFCVGSMALMGCIESGLHNNQTILLTKSIIDGIIAVFFAATLGIGVLFSAFSVVLYEGLLTFLASLFADLISKTLMAEMSAVGGVVLLGVAINMLQIKKIKTADMVLSLFMPIAVFPIINLIH